MSSVSMPFTDLMMPHVMFITGIAIVGQRKKRKSKNKKKSTLSCSLIRIPFMYMNVIKGEPRKIGICILPASFVG